MPLIKFSIIRKAYQHRAVWRLAVALTLAGALCLMSPSPASAQDLNPADYFQFSYDPVSFDKSEIHGSEVFYATIAGRATCTKDLPVSASEAKITSQVVAVHTVSGTKVTLNSNYTVAIKPFPAKKDDTAEINQAVPLQFPAEATSGDYNIIGKIVEAKVKVTFVWLNVTGYFPQEQPMGLVKYTASESSATLPPPSVPPTPSAAPLTSSPPSTPPPTPEPTLAPASSPEPPEPIIPWWAEMIVLVAAVAVVFNIVRFLRHRHR